MREGGKYDPELTNIYSWAQVVCKIYSKPLWPYSEPLNFFPNPALFRQCSCIFVMYFINLLSTWIILLTYLDGVQYKKF